MSLSSSKIKIGKELNVCICTCKNPQRGACGLSPLCMDGWMDGWVGGWMYVCMHIYVAGRMLKQVCRMLWVRGEGSGFRV